MKKEMQRLFPAWSFKVKAHSYSGGQSSYIFMFGTSEQILKSKDECHEAYMNHFSWSNWHTVHAGNGTREVWGQDMEYDLRLDAFEIFYDRLVKLYQEQATCIEYYLTDEAAHVWKTAKSLYNSFIHDESNSMVDYFDRNLYDHYEFCVIDNAGSRKEWEA